MTVPGETDLDVMLRSLAAERRPGVFTFVEIDPADSLDPAALRLAHAMVVEDGSTTLVLRSEDARQLALPVLVEMAWLTITVESSLEAIGLTAAFSALLGDAGIACNVLAGFRHDHVLVPLDRVDDAIAVLSGESS